jgi:membrane dipeptidase
MHIIDGHCDAISKLLVNQYSNFYDSNVLDVTLPRLQTANVKLQCFAIYIPAQFAPYGIQSILMSIDLYYRHILNNPGIIPIHTKTDMSSLITGSQIGALLTLEGVDALAGNMRYIPILHRLGLRSIGLTWNHANWAADGTGEPRGGGLTIMGKQLVTECEKLGILMDVSHLSEKAFWDLAAMANMPFYASHSNVFEICKHPRNLKKDQILEIIRIGGCIGLTFVPYFVQANKPVVILDLLRHIDYICALGGTENLAFGSDFDGIDQWIEGLEHPGQYSNLHNILLRHYKENDVQKWLYKNWYRYFYDNI